jgi:hypothetical protein
MRPIEGVDPARVDEAQLFSIYATFCGDVFKTAAAAGITPQAVTEHAEANNWLERIRSLIDLKEKDNSGEIERSLSRSLNFVQVSRYRLCIERMLRNIERKSDDELMDMMVTRTYDKEGNVTRVSMSAKIFAEMATAMEKVHWMSYQSLMDAPTDRAGRREKPRADLELAEDIHAKIAKTLAGTSVDPIGMLADSYKKVVETPSPASEPTIFTSPHKPIPPEYLEGKGVIVDRDDNVIG